MIPPTISSVDVHQGPFLGLEVSKSDMMIVLET